MIKLLLNVLFVLLKLVPTPIESSFPKDLDINIQFPPILDRRDGIPTGHLRPLGWQNRADGPVHEESVMLQPEEFWNNYINKSKPMVTRGLVLGSDAVDRWTDVHLNKAYGGFDIKVTERKQRFVGVEERLSQMPFTRFLKNYRVEDWYLRVIMPEDMQKETPIPHILNCGPLNPSPLSQKSTKEQKPNEHDQSKLTKDKLSTYEDKSKFELPRIAQLIEPYLWISAGETSSLLHSHPEHNLHCVLDGRKDFILIPVDQFTRSEPTSPNKKYDKNYWRNRLDLYETFPSSSEWYSKIDVDMVNAFKYNILHSVVWYWASLRAGDCIYIPANYLHQIRSHGRSISSSIYFTRLNIEKNKPDYLNEVTKAYFSQCSQNAPLFENMHSLRNEFVWTYTHSERHLKLLNIEESDAKRYLLYLMRMDNSLSFERFDVFYKEISHELKANIFYFDLAEQELINLNSSDIWQDFFKTETNNPTFNSQDQMPVISKSILFSLKENVNLNRFMKILKASANYHYREYKLKSGKDEL